MREANKTIADAVSSEMAKALTLPLTPGAEILAELSETLVKSLTLVLAHIARGDQGRMGLVLDATTNVMHEYGGEILPAARLVTAAAQFGRPRP